MDRTLSGVTYCEGNIVSGKCSGDGQLFMASVVALADPEWGLVGAFGGHECTAAPLKPVA